MLLIYKILRFFLLFKILIINFPFSANAEANFETWLTSYKNFALKKGISQETINIAFKNVKFLEQVIKYDRKQPEFFENTTTYVNKRANSARVKTAKKLFEKNKNLFDDVESNFYVEKEILLALWGIETNFGKHVGKMDIISSLATLSYDKRRRDFFSSQLLILLKLIDDKLVDPDTLYGSWAGAYGNFQFMPSSIKHYAIDYDNNNKIELKSSLDDSLASAANYINKIGWKKGQPCFFRVKLTNNIKDKSKNTLPFDFLTLGELFQNNHHRFPNRLNFGVRKWEFDPIYPIIRLFDKLSIIQIVKEKKNYLVNRVKTLNSSSK